MDWLKQTASNPATKTQAVELLTKIEAALPEGERLNPRDLEWQWRFMARREQLPPVGSVEWFVWMVMAGRGFGKTRCGAEWVRGLANKEPWAWGGEKYIPAEHPRIALVADNAEDAVKVMIKGRSGLLNVCPIEERPWFKPSEKALYWPNGAMAFYYSAEDAEQLRGPEHHMAWVDELAKFRNPIDVWDNLLMGLRLGEYPRICITTTPRPHPILKQIVSESDTELTRGSTYDNKANLPKRFLNKLEELYEGTRVGRQELHAELLTDIEGALFSTRLFDEHRLRAVPPEVSLERVVVSIDPPATSSERSNLAGITVTGKGDDGHGYVLTDASLPQARPEDWAREAVKQYYLWEADCIVAETNNGGDMVESVVRSIQPDVPYKSVWASRGKVVRAEPASALYEQGKIHHVGVFEKLEEQLLMFAPGVKFDPEDSPDRGDSLVWGLTELFNLGEVGGLLLGQHRN